jgi:hypothetical protein
MKKASLWALITALVIFVLIGFALLGLGVYLLHNETAYLQKAERTTAVVTDNKLYPYAGQYSQDYTYYCSEFQFRTKDGQDVTVEENNGCGKLDGPPDYQIGQKVDLYYDPQDPGNFQIPDFTGQYSAAVAATVAGGLFVLVGLGIFWIGMLARRKMTSTAGVGPRGSARSPMTTYNASDDSEAAVLAEIEQAEAELKKSQRK